MVFGLEPEAGRNPKVGCVCLCFMIMFHLKKITVKEVSKMDCYRIKKREVKTVVQKRGNEDISQGSSRGE